MVPVISDEARKILEETILSGGAKFVISEDMSAVRLENENEIVTPSDVGRALALIVSNKDILDPTIAFLINGWNVYGDVHDLDEVNFGSICDGIVAVLPYENIEVRLDESADRLSVSIDEDALFIDKDGYSIRIDGSVVNESVRNNELNFDQFIKVDAGLTPEEKRKIFEQMNDLMVEKLVSKELQSPSLFTELTLGLFDAIRLGNDEIYRVVEESFLKQGIDIDIRDMKAEAICTDDDDRVVYRFTPTEYKINNNVSIFNADDEEDQPSHQTKNRM